MSSSELPAVLEFSDPYGVAQLSVADSRLRTVACGTGQLRAELKPGFYRLEANAAGITTIRLIELTPGQTYTERAGALLASPAPLDGTRTSHEYHQQVAAQASERLAGQGGTGLAVIVRSLRDRPGSPITDAGVESFDLIGESHVIPLDWEVTPDLDVAATVTPLPPGGYALSHAASRQLPGTGAAGLAQAVNVIPGHQTLVFVPNTLDGPRFEMASVHITADVWSPSDPANLATEAIFQSLAAGTPVVPRFDSSWITRAPMLGMLAIHALALSPNADMNAARELVSVTQTALKGGPDATPLLYVVEERLAQREGRRPRPEQGHAAPATTPPMLRVGYDALVSLDIAGGAPFVPSSPAEQTAEYLVEHGPWTTWLARPFASSPGVRPEPVSFPIDLAEIGSHPGAVQSLGPGARRVASYLVSVAEAAAHDPENAVSEVEERQVAAACRLSVQTVRRAHEELSSMLIST